MDFSFFNYKVLILSYLPTKTNDTFFAQGSGRWKEIQLAQRHASNKHKNKKEHTKMILGEAKYKKMTWKG